MGCAAGCACGTVYVRELLGSAWGGLGRRERDTHGGRAGTEREKDSGQVASSD